MANTYNVHYAGEVITGHEPAQVRARLGKLFGADDATLDKLFSGRTRLIKKGCDRATAEKYRAAMQRAGAVAILEPPLEAQTASADQTAAPAPAPAGGRQQDEHPATQAAATAAGGDAALQLRPPQSAVLEEHERTRHVPREVDTSALAVGEQGERLSPEAPPAPPAPDTSHLGIAEAGADIPGMSSDAPPPAPNTDAIGLAPEGTDFSDCAAATAPPPQLDLSGIQIAAEGEDLLEERYRDTTAPPAPDTDHLSLKD